MNVDDLTPHDLDQLSRLIADALQVVDQDQGPNRGLFQGRSGPRDLTEQERGEQVESREEVPENTPTQKPQEGTPVIEELRGSFDRIHSFTQLKHRSCAMHRKLSSMKTNQHPHFTFNGLRPL